MRGKALARRKARNAELAQADAARRCRVCKRVIAVALYAPYCSQDCVVTAADRIGIDLKTLRDR